MTIREQVQQLGTELLTLAGLQADVEERQVKLAGLQTDIEERIDGCKKNLENLQKNVDETLVDMDNEHY